MLSSRIKIAGFLFGCLQLPLLSLASVLELPTPTAMNAMPTVELSPTGIVVNGEKLFFVFPKNSLYLRTKWSAYGKTPAEKFGDLLSQVRVDVKAPPMGSRWVGGWAIGKQLVWLDGAELNTVAIGIDDAQEKTYRSIPWEGVVRPGRDRGGEAGRPETKALQAKFKKEFQNAGPVRIAGVASMEGGLEHEKEDGTHSKHFTLAVLTRLPSFPFGVISCQIADPSQCSWERACAAPGLTMNPTDRLSLAYDSQDRLLLVGSASTRDIQIFKFSSCLAISPVGKMLLPEKIKLQSSMAIDTLGRLFIGTVEPDNYFNASVFVWEKSDWKAVLPKKGTKSSHPR